MSDEDLLKNAGWTVECYSPLEIRHEDGSFATLTAARIVTAYIREHKDDDRDE